MNKKTSPCGIPQCVWDVRCSAGDGTGYRGLVSKATLEGGESVDCQVSKLEKTIESISAG